MTYWFVNRAFDWSVVLQLVWTFDEVVDAAALAQMNAELAVGSLNRRVVLPSVPIARPRWSHSPATPDVVIDTLPIGADGIEAWADGELETVTLDPVDGSAWRLRGVPTADGGFVVSLTTLHLVADGRGMVAAAVAAATSGGSSDPVPLSTRRAVLADLADVLTVVSQAGSGVARALTSAVRSTTDDGPPPPARAVRAPMHERSPSARTRWAVVSVSAAHWEEVARRHHGTSNILFVAVIAGALRAAGHLPADEPIKVGIPVSRRTEGDDRANATAGVSVMVRGEVTAGGDLTALRRLCKQAYERLAAGTRPAMMHLRPLMNVLPVSVVAKVATAGNGMPDVMTSNLGVFGPEVARIGGHTASAVAFRGDAQGVDPDLHHRFGDGLQSWSVQVGDTLTFSVAAFDESAFAGASELRAGIAAELDAWGVVHRIW
ncbi:hypothetical protein [Williamsia phyllosphaerae]|nr:hypothetical protein [Williamsia phyllosphaerae]